jgi:hypothetical protein
MHSIIPDDVAAAFDSRKQKLNQRGSEYAEKDRSS